MNNRQHLIAGLAAALLAPGLAMGQDTQAELRSPTDNELHAAYCITLLHGLLKDDTGYSIKDAAGRNLQQIRIAALERLEAYMAAWHDDVNPDKLAIAETRGHVDLDSIKKIEQRKTTYGPMGPRLNACQSPDWLPF